MTSEHSRSPCAGGATIWAVTGSPSGSAPSRRISVGAPEEADSWPSSATGAALGAMVIESVAVFDVKVPSEAWNVRASGPR